MLILHELIIINLICPYN